MMTALCYRAFGLFYPFTLFDSQSTCGLIHDLYYNYIACTLQSYKYYCLRERGLPLFCCTRNRRLSLLASVPPCLPHPGSGTTRAVILSSLNYAFGMMLIQKPATLNLPSDLFSKGDDRFRGFCWIRLPSD